MASPACEKAPVSLQSCRDISEEMVSYPVANRAFGPAPVLTGTIHPPDLSDTNGASGPRSSYPFPCTLPGRSPVFRLSLKSTFISSELYFLTAWNARREEISSEGIP